MACPPRTPPPAGAVENVWATNLDGEYNEDEDSTITSSTLDLSACTGQSITMTVRHSYEIESSWDGGVIEVSTNGSTWDLVTPADGYDDDISGLGEAFSGDSGGDNSWVTDTVDLSSYAGEASLQVRFRLVSDSIVEDNGWYIDAVSIVAS